MKRLKMEIYCKRKCENIEHTYFHNKEREMMGRGHREATTQARRRAPEVRKGAERDEAGLTCSVRLAISSRIQSRATSVRA